MDLLDTIGSVLSIPVGSATSSQLPVDLQINVVNATDTDWTVYSPRLTTNNGTIVNKLASPGLSGWPATISAGTAVTGDLQPQLQTLQETVWDGTIQPIPLVQFNLWSSQYGPSFIVYMNLAGTPGQQISITYYDLGVKNCPDGTMVPASQMAQVLVGEVPSLNPLVAFPTIYNPVIANIVLSGNENVGYYGSNPPQNWMQSMLGMLGGLTLRQLCLPFSHDAGMSRLTWQTEYVNEKACLTQSLDIAGQLAAGSRVFDIRPVVAADGSWSGFSTGHYQQVADRNDYEVSVPDTWYEDLGNMFIDSEIPANGLYLGGNGQPISEIISQINAFTANNQELIILELSHAYKWQDSSMVDMDQDDWTALFTELGQLNNLFTLNADKLDLSSLTLSQFIGNGKAAVVVAVSVNIGMTLPSGFYYGNVSDPNNPFLANWSYNSAYLGSMSCSDTMNYQFSQLALQRPNPGAWLFGSAWTLTLNAEAAIRAAMDNEIYTGPGILDYSATMKPWLFMNLMSNCSPMSFPNLIGIDNIGPEVTTLAIAVNVCYARLTLNYHLTIDAAAYGPADVTQLVQSNYNSWWNSHIPNFPFSVWANNGAMGGDPDYGVVKTLTVLCRQSPWNLPPDQCYGSGAQVFSAGENSYVSIYPGIPQQPQPSDSFNIQTMVSTEIDRIQAQQNSTGTLRIAVVRATYALQENYTLPLGQTVWDVTPQIQANLTDSAAGCTFMCNPAFFAYFDPAPGVVKILSVMLRQWADAGNPTDPFTTSTYRFVTTTDGSEVVLQPDATVCSNYVESY